MRYFIRTIQCEVVYHGYLTHCRVSALVLVFIARVLFQYRSHCFSHPYQSSLCIIYLRMRHSYSYNRLLVVNNVLFQEHILKSVMIQIISNNNYCTMHQGKTPATPDLHANSSPARPVASPPPLHRAPSLNPHSTRPVTALTITLAPYKSTLYSQVLF